MEQNEQEMLSALIDTESSNDPNAFNEKSGARGLTQLRQIAWDDLVEHFPERYAGLDFKRDMFKPEIAIQAGRDYITIIRRYLRNYGMPETMDNILAAYNWGIGNLRKQGLENAPQQTKDYIEKIRHLLQPQAEQMDNLYYK